MLTPALGLVLGLATAGGEPRFGIAAISGSAVCVASPGTPLADGTAVVRCNIPPFHEGTAAVIISAHSELGNDEVKQLVKKRK